MHLKQVSCIKQIKTMDTEICFHKDELEQKEKEVITSSTGPISFFPLEYLPNNPHFSLSSNMIQS